MKPFSPLGSNLPNVRVSHGENQSIRRLTAQSLGIQGRLSCQSLPWDLDSLIRSSSVIAIQQGAHVTDQAIDIDVALDGAA